MQIATVDEVSARFAKVQEDLQQTMFSLMSQQMPSEPPEMARVISGYVQRLAREAQEVLASEALLQLNATATKPIRLSIEVDHEGDDQGGSFEIVSVAISGQGGSLHAMDADSLRDELVDEFEDSKVLLASLGIGEDDVIALESDQRTASVDTLLNAVEVLTESSQALMWDEFELGPVKEQKEAA